MLSEAPYEPGSHECCCGDKSCNDFEERMARWGIPLEELTTVTMIVPLGRSDTEESSDGTSSRVREV